MMTHVPLVAGTDPKPSLPVQTGSKENAPETSSASGTGVPSLEEETACTECVVVLGGRHLRLCCESVLNPAWEGANMLELQKLQSSSGPPLILSKAAQALIGQF